MLLTLEKIKENNRLTGKTYQPLTALADELEIDVFPLNKFYNKFNNIETAIEKSREVISRSIELWNKQYKGITDIALTFGLNEKSLWYQSRKGIDTEIAVTNLLSKSQIFFRGNSYNNLTSLCNEYGVQPLNITYRLKHGWSLEETIIKPVISTGKGKEVSFRGKFYTGRLALCREYKVSYNGIVKKATTMGSWLNAFKLFIQLKEKSGIKPDEQLDSIPRCINRGRRYPSLQDLAIKMNITSATIGSYKKVHKIENLFEVLNSMQSERVEKYKVNDDEIYSKNDLLKKGYTVTDVQNLYGKYKQLVPLYPELQNWDFETECVDTFLIYKELKKQMLEEIQEVEKGMIQQM